MKGAAKNPFETKAKIDTAASLVPGGGGENQPQNTINKTTIVRADPNKKPIAASADLFDIVKGQLLDEGIDEKDALKIMVELSQQDLKKIVDEGIMPRTLGGALVRSAATTAGLLAARQAGKKVKQKVDDALNKARDQSGGNKRVDDVRSQSGDSSVGQKIKF